MTGFRAELLSTVPLAIRVLFSVLCRFQHGIPVTNATGLCCYLYTALLHTFRCAEPPTRSVVAFNYHRNCRTAKHTCSYQHH